MVEIFEQFTSQKIGGDSFGSASIGYADVFTEVILLTPIINKNISVGVEVIVHSQPQAFIGRLTKTKHAYSRGSAGSRIVQKTRASHAWSKANDGSRHVFGIKDLTPVAEYIITDELEHLMTEDDEFLVTNNTKNLK